MTDEIRDFPPVVFFHQGSADEGRALFDRFWPEARAVSDPELWFFKSVGIGRGKLRQVLGPAVWIAGARSMLRGSAPGRPVGDVWIMPAMLLVEEGRIVWRHDYRHSGDGPDLEQVARGPV